MDHRRYNSTEYTRMADEVKAFREKLIELLQYSERTGPFGPVGAWEVPTNSEAFERIKPEVSQLAGSAQVGVKSKCVVCEDGHCVISSFRLSVQQR